MLINLETHYANTNIYRDHYCHPLSGKRSYQTKLELLLLEKDSFRQICKLLAGDALHILLKTIFVFIIFGSGS